MKVGILNLKMIRKDVRIININTLAESEPISTCDLKHTTTYLQ